MRSRASIKSHPIHPILVVFPVAFFTGTLVCDVLAFINKSDSIWQMGKYLEIAGIGSAIAAAIPGIIDYSYTVPPKSSAKTRAGKHAILNTVMLGLFVTSVLCRNNIDLIIIATEAVGMVLLSVAGWMGGTLVHRNQIGVDPRYANAGKWKESYFGQSAGSIEVADSDELGVNQMKLLHIADERIVLARTEKGYVAFDDRCTHKGGSLAGGAMMCGTVQCPWHGSQFDVENGEMRAGPAKEKISIYTLKERNGKVYINL